MLAQGVRVLIKLFLFLKKARIVSEFKEMVSFNKNKTQTSLIGERVH